MRPKLSRRSRVVPGTFVTMAPLLLEVLLLLLDPRRPLELIRRRRSLSLLRR